MGVMPHKAVFDFLSGTPSVTSLAAITNIWPAEERVPGDPNATPTLFVDGYMIPCVYVAPAPLQGHPEAAWMGINDAWVYCYCFAQTRTDRLDQIKQALYDALHMRQIPGVLDGYGWVRWADDGVRRVNDPFPDTDTDYSRFRVTVRRDTASPDF